ncbi:DUF1761 domain-containing protein [Caulobacter vibrioides]|nr:DUF1761 domain-containing protein [Caulobacter vibrioides]YP_009020525.1 hypothetical protein CCNA_03953 [Caulobacter vibrioides NA1000]AHI88556.1 hypothetical protein CCNA_03953 [Caulobacter vibrioides NA1000]ATC28283.1 DUF1761 domain-containing protein [Caulobacter vibrioides]QXZ53550.1 DUF1761 domain-containing protein [Caulobacter vibrioides]
MKQVNWLGLVVALIAGQVIGVIWYGNLFSAAWMEAQSLTDADFVGQDWKMGLGVLNMIVILLGLDWLIRRLGASGYMAGAKVALAACVCFALTVAALNYIYAAGTLSLLLIDGGYQVVTYTVAGALLGGLKRKPKAA